jgi:type VI secretion system protein ImpH
MATSRRRPPASLIAELRASPERFAFLQAIRILERAALFASRDHRFVSPERIGFDHDPRREVLFLRAALELAFPATDVTAFNDSGNRPELSVAVMGLNGPSGVLPGHYSQLVMEALRDKNTALRDFLDIFNHRALSLFARAMEKYRLPLAYERAGYGSEDAISGALYALLGMHEQTLRRRQAVPDATLLFYAGHFSQQPRTAGALGQILSDYFDRPVRIAQFQGRWVNLPESEQTVLGGGRANPGYYTQLGVNAVVGSRIWDVQGSFRVHLGPLDYEQFFGFMPHGAQMAELAALARSYVGPALSFDVQLTLKANEIPPLKLSTDEQAGPRLGWNTWMPSARPRREASDAVFRMEAV